MSRKMEPQIELEAAAYPHASPDLIIRNEFDKFIDNRKETNEKNRRFILYFLIALSLALLSYIYFPKAADFAVRKINYFKTAKIENTLKIYGYEIKASALKNFKTDQLALYDFDSDSAVHEYAAYARLIHIYNNDFYGRPMNLSEISERRLWAYMNTNAFDVDDLCDLDRPFSGDENLSLRQWLLNICSNPNHNNKLFNPRIAELLDLKNIYENELNEELRRPFNDEQIRELRIYALDNNIRTDNSQDVILGVLDHINDKPAFLEYIYFLRNELQRIDHEIDIRLALAGLNLASQYNYRGNYQLYGWLNADKRGAEMLKRNRAFNNQTELYNELKNAYGRFAELYRTSSEIFDELNLDYYDYVIENPIRIGLKVKDVGLFGVRRKTDGGILYEHKGIDLMADMGTPVFPVRRGYIIDVKANDSGHGNHVVIWHDNGLTTTYSHMEDDEHFRATLSKFNAEGPGWVGLNTRIGSVGTSGNIPEGDPQYGYAHLHLEIQESNIYKNPFLMLNEKLTVIH